MTEAQNENGSKGTAVVTGASAGIGKVYANRLAGRGYDLILVARRGDRLADVAAPLREQFGVKVETVVADLANAADLEKVAEKIAADASVTLLVNNAGTATFGPVAQTGQGAIDAMNDVNLTALVRLTRAVLPGFKTRDHGTIINIGSVLGFAALPFSAVYSGTKAYVQFFTRGIQTEVAGTNVRVQLVCPAATATEIWEISGVPVTQFDPATVMSAENCVDAALAGLDLGEAVTLPSVEDPTLLLAAYASAAGAILSSSQNGKPASRYNIAR
ncbi:MAG: SDR family oxidoreductase [Beijerinckiaceae bacterium]|jgi:short-subunit dehydrogenase